MFLLLLFPSLSFAGSPFESIKFAAGAQEKWLTSSESRDFEATIDAAVPITGHLSVTGGLAYGFAGAYVRGLVDARLTSTDSWDQDFKIWVGAGKFFSDDISDGLNEWAGKAGVEYKLLPRFPVVFGLSAAYGLDTDRRQVTLFGSYPFKLGARSGG